MRHEYKHQINYEDYLVIKSRLKVLAKQDPHADSDGKYVIHSLYFDNFSDKALHEKLDGLDRREKFRIRYYNHDTDYICLEKKSRISGLCDKQSAPLTKEEVIKICHGDISFLRLSDHALLQELYVKMKQQLLKPKVIVDYEREPYIYEPGNVRITLDQNIRVGLYPHRLFEESHIGIPVSRDIILEVKYDAFLPEIMEKAVRVPCRQASAFSKYAACRIYG